MCSIVGSFDYNIINELVPLNSSRGTLSSSYTTFDNSGRVIQVVREKGKLGNLPLHNGYLLCHQQAPTSYASEKNIHPSVYKNALMWHNGILKQHFLKSAGAEKEWDTQYLNQVFTETGVKGLEDIEGSFACVHHNGTELVLFRNTIAPMWHKDATISSVTFLGAEEFEPNTLYKLDFERKRWNAVSEFTNVEAPFYFA